MKGRFSNKRTRWVLSLQSGFWRWNPNQQNEFEKTLNEVVKDNDRDTPAAIFALNQIAALPDVSHKVLFQLASLKNPKLVAREAALRAMAKLDRGQGVPIFIESLDDERARIAIYALRRNLLEMAPARAVELLASAPLEKVTVAKEIVRLLGDLKTPKALDLLLEKAEQPLHRDVRVALLRALWEHLEDARVWPILEAAAVSDEIPVAQMAARTTAPRLSRATRQKLLELLALLLNHPAAPVRLDTLQRLQSAPVSDPQNTLQAPLFAALELASSDEYNAAAQAIFGTYGAPKTGDAALIERAIAQLLPRRRALQSVVSAFKNQLFFARRDHLAAAQAIFGALEADPLVLPLRVELGVAALPLPELASWLEHLADADLLDFEAMNAAREALGEAAQWRPMFGETKAFGELEEVLFASKNSLVRRLGLAALVGLARDGKGWTQARLERLELYRADSASVVASAAQFTFAAGEE